MKDDETLCVTQKEFYNAMMIIFMFFWCTLLTVGLKDKGIGQYTLFFWGDRFADVLFVQV